MDTLWTFELHVPPSLGFRFVTGFCFIPRWAYEDVGKKVLYITLIGIHKQHYCPERFLCIADKGMYKWHRPQRRFEVLTPCDCRKMLTFTNVMTCHKLSWHLSPDKQYFKCHDILQCHSQVAVRGRLCEPVTVITICHLAVLFSRLCVLCVFASWYNIFSTLTRLQIHSSRSHMNTGFTLSRYVNIDLWCLLRHYCIKLQIHHILLTSQPKR